MSITNSSLLSIIGTAFMLASLPYFLNSSMLDTNSSTDNLISTPFVATSLHISLGPMPGANSSLLGLICTSIFPQDGLN